MNSNQPFGRISQGTMFWKCVREYCGITASEVADLFSMGYGSPRQRFLSKVGEHKKERHTQFQERALAHGHLYESEARNVLEGLVGSPIQQFGLLLHPSHGFDVAGSPDGYIEESMTLVEIKCPFFTLSEEAERRPYQEVKPGHLIQMIVLMEIMDCNDALYMSFAVPKDGNLLNVSFTLFEIQRQKEIWKEFLEPEISKFLEHVKNYHENVKVGPYKGATREVKSKLLAALQKIEKIKRV